MSVGRVRSTGIGRPRGRVGDAAAHLLQQRKRAASARHVRAVGEQHHEQIAIGVGPERGARPPSVAEAPRPEQRSRARDALPGRYRLPPQRPGFVPAPNAVALDVNKRTVSSRSRRRPSRLVPPRRTNWANRATSAAVENTPALPDTPRSLNALPSLTVPATG